MKSLLHEHESSGRRLSRNPKRMLCTCRLSRVGRLTHVYSLPWVRAMMNWGSTQKLRRWGVLILVGCYVAVDETAVRPHLPVTPMQLMNPGIGWNMSLCSVWLCVTCNLYALFQEDVVRWLFMSSAPQPLFHVIPPQPLSSTVQKVLLVLQAMIAVIEDGNEAALEDWELYCAICCQHKLMILQWSRTKVTCTVADVTSLLLQLYR